MSKRRHVHVAVWLVHVHVAVRVVRVYIRVAAVWLVHEAV